jgi:tRNA-dihydrouridine synthase
VEICDELKSETLIFGNGDIVDVVNAREKAKESGADGVMLGRAIFGNPWLFSKTQNVANISLEDKMDVMVEHAELFEELLGGVKNFSIMKKHFKAYVNGFDGASELRADLMETNSAEEVKNIVINFLSSKKPII